MADDTRAFRVLLIGGYGFFGQRLANRLARMHGVHILIAGRDPTKARALADRLRSETIEATVEAVTIDMDADDFSSRLATFAPDTVAHTGGPFQGQDYRVARACIAAGAHYVDLADARRFVCDIVTLDTAARAAGVLVVSGASSVPALSGAAIDRLASAFARVDSIDAGINPGNRTERGLATVRAILGYCGVSFPVRRDGRDNHTIGWLTPRRVAYPAPVGTRWISDCDVPDLELLPARYPDVRDVTFGGGLELGILHMGMILFAWMRHLHLVKDWTPHAGWLKRLSDLFLPFGTDGGAMHIVMRGQSTRNEPLERRWFLVALRGDGPYVPTLAAAAIVRGLRDDRIAARGAMPCLGLLDLDDILAEGEGLAITTHPPC